MPYTITLNIFNTLDVSDNNLAIFSLNPSEQEFRSNRSIVPNLWEIAARSVLAHK